MTDIERIEEERFVESMICLWIQPDAPEWIIDYVRQELRKQRGLLEQEEVGMKEHEESKYSEEIKEKAVKPNWYYGGTPFCGNCGYILQKKNGQHVKERLLKCPKCGTVVKWK